MIQVSLKTNNKTYTPMGLASYASESKQDLEDMLKDIKQFMIEISKEVLTEEQGRGFDKNPTTLVDGRKKPVSSVNYLGKIEHIASQNIDVMVKDVYSMIQEKSKVVTGLYKSLNYVLLDNKIIATNEGELTTFFESPPLFFPGSRITFVNIAPYAQRMELQGVTKGRVSMKVGKSRDKREERKGVMVRKPNGVYALSSRAAKRKYGKLARVKFELLPSDYLGFTRPIPPNSKQKFRATFDPNGRYNAGFYILPTISIIIGESGIRGVMQ